MWTATRSSGRTSIRSRSWATLSREWIFIDEGLAEGGHGTAHPFDPDDPISSGMQQVLFLVGGAFRPAAGSKLDFNQLAVTGRNSGTISYQDYEMTMRTRGMMGVRRNLTREPYIIAAHVTGQVEADDELYLSDKKDTTPQTDTGRRVGFSRRCRCRQDRRSAPKTPPTTTRWPARNRRRTRSTSCSSPTSTGSRRSSSALREMGQDPDMLIDWKFQNVPFVLNILDSLAGDDRFIDLRKRTRPIAS